MTIDDSISLIKGQLGVMRGMGVHEAIKALELCLKALLYCKENKIDLSPYDNHPALT